MARPKKLEKNKKIFVPITLDKNIYFYLKKRDVKISTYINQMLKVALNKGSRENDNFYDPNLSTLVRLRSRVRLSPEALKGAFTLYLKKQSFKFCFFL
ncbi:MAG: hypothetical protein PHQ07_03595 [Candidatus ainarchaeum sp.]|nr:hypothetical protein [Candidatus ainarchaeum sp.]